MDIISTALASKANKRITQLVGNSRLEVPTGTTAERPTLGIDNRAIRYNTDTDGLEQWDGNTWANISASITAVNLKGTDTEANILAMVGMATEDLWIASDTLDGWVYDGSQWVNIGPLQGPQGVQGVPGSGIASIVRTNGDGSPGTVDTYTITYNDATTSTFDVTNGSVGTDGATWLYGAVDPTTEGVDGYLYLNTVSMDVFAKAAGTWTLQVNIKGDDGNSISTVVRTSGDGSPGMTDTYTITYTDASTSTFDIYNGLDGSSVDHVSQTAGDGSPGTIDTYTVWGDAGETENLGTFSVYNGLNGTGSIDDNNMSDTTLWSSSKTNSTILDTSIAMAIALG
jgi:hypothetical protein